ncbi:winged helix-turn-helix transcriptional regulator [Methanobacterium ferruginis]|uniref:winged helix-turn-helix transcriptional regulator n=1 Tax=Methanobacterium ferruginis TaxID=710191 RepID=UPI0025732627|nr:helix-turn-helix domain-containing protein [Methanobacterium ferruginis]BDZ67944.1 hypothetical protein GCM10025860_13920 [Methanobacterium ferruginis]
MKKLNEDYQVEYELAVLTLGQNLISGKWTILILWELSKGTKRFSELYESLRYTSRSVFTKQLRELENSGLIKREVYDEKPIKVEYSLTEIGEKLIPVLYALSDWSEDYAKSQKEEGTSVIDFLQNSSLSDKYKAYKDVNVIPKK